MRYWEDFTVGMTMEFGGYEVTEEEIIEFATDFDPQSFHVDREAAKEHYFGGIIASGWHTASMCMRMLVDNFMGDSASMGSPGIDQLRWKKPVRPGDILRVKVTVLESRPLSSRPELGLVKFDHSVTNQHGEEKMTMISTVMFRRDPARMEKEAGK